MLPRLGVYRSFFFARRLKHSVRMEARLISFSAIGAASSGRDGALRRPVIAAR
jgi:hypothetical protein